MFRGSQMHRTVLTSQGKHTLLLSYHVLIQSFMQTPDKQTVALYERLVKVLNPTYRKLVDRTTTSLEGKAVDSRSLTESLTKNPFTANLRNEDIMALVFIVMMEAAKSAQEDLKAIMDGVKAINKEKQALREKIREQQRINKDALGAAYKVPVEIEKVETDELQQLKMQIVMDRLAHFYTTISNIMKAIADDAKNIINNLK